MGLLRFEFAHGDGETAEARFARLDSLTPKGFVRSEVVRPHFDDVQVVSWSYDRLPSGGMMLCALPEAVTLSGDLLPDAVTVPLTAKNRAVTPCREGALHLYWHVLDGMMTLRFFTVATGHEPVVD